MAGNNGRLRKNKRVGPDSDYGFEFGNFFAPTPWTEARSGTAPAPTGRRRTSAIRARPEIKTPAKYLQESWKEIVALLFSPDMDAIAGYAEWIIEMRRKFHHGNVCYFREAFVVLSPSAKKMFFNRIVIATHSHTCRIQSGGIVCAD